MKDNPISEPALVISVISEATVLTVPPGLISSSSQVIIIIFFKPSVSIPEGGLKIDENKLKGYDAQSVQSVTGRLSCSRTALKRCTSTETR